MTKSFQFVKWMAIAAVLPAPFVLACAQPHMDVKLPSAFQAAVLDRMAQTSFIGRDQLRIVQSTRATWQDCLHPSADQLLDPSCQAVARSGWRVTVQGNSESWTYYVTDKGFTLLDAPASLNSKIQAALVKSLSVAPQDLKIMAAEPYAIADTSQCPAAALCKIRPIPGWKVLVSNASRLFYFNYQGQSLPMGDFRGFLPRNLAGLPPSFAAAAIRDVQDRHGLLPANFKVESVSSVTWSPCGGGTGPTPPEMGTCPMGTLSGWQLRASGASMRWVYYWSKETTAQTEAIAIPDGAQSLPAQVANAVLRATAQRDHLPLNQYQLHRTTGALFLNRCLNRESDALHCRQGIQSGWQVSVLGGKPVTPNSSFGSPISTYISSLDGRELHLIDRGNWAPPP